MNSYIKSEFQEQYCILCKQYKDLKTSVEAEVWYLVIRVWWQCCGATDESTLIQLEQWLVFWHFCLRK